jgi:hypothetical protein
MKAGAKGLFCSACRGACGGMVWIMLIGSVPAWGQSASPPAATSQEHAGLDAKIRVLTDSLEQTRAELSESRQEIRDLRSMLEQVMQKMGQQTGVSGGVSSAVSTGGATAVSTGAQVTSSVNASPQKPGERESAQISSDDWQIVNARLEEQEQDKVESNLKYRVKLSGMVLLNAFAVSGQVDNVDVPTVAMPKYAGFSGSVGASLRQSVIGITGIGPEIFGANTVGDVQMDFFGGLPGGYASNTSGLVRLRVARIRMNWTHTSLFGGIDAPFFSPNVPTSYMSVAVPGFAAAGNLWTWTPTIGVEERIDAGKSQIRIDAGAMDPPSYAGEASSVRIPSPQEYSRQPTFAVRASENAGDERHPFAFGISAIYSPQRFAGGTTVSGWGGVADWRFPVFPRAEISGELFAGKGIDAFGGVPTPVPPAGDYNYYAVAVPQLEGITMAGGWTELKYKLDTRNEFNFGIGTGGRDSDDFREVQALDPTALSTLSPRNQMLFVNYIFRPRSDLLFSPEFRRLRTYPSSGSVAIADQIGLAAAFLF